MDDCIEHTFLFTFKIKCFNIHVLPKQGYREKFRFFLQYMYVRIESGNCYCRLYNVQYDCPDPLFEHSCM